MDQAAAATPDLNKIPDGAIAATLEDQKVGEAGYLGLKEAARTRSAPDPADAGLGVEFYKHPVDGLDHVRIRIPGDKLYQPDFVADDRHKVRFARQWEAYKSEQSQFAGQVMLESVAWIDMGMREHLAYYGIKTIEGLANVPDGNLDALGHGTRALRDRAKAEVEAKLKAASFDGLKAELDSMKAELETLRAAAPRPQNARGKDGVRENAA